MCVRLKRVNIASRGPPCAGSLGRATHIDGHVGEGGIEVIAIDARLVDPEPWAAPVSALEALGPFFKGSIPDARVMSGRGLAAVSGDQQALFIRARGGNWLEAHLASQSSLHE